MRTHLSGSCLSLRLLTLIVLVATGSATASTAGRSPGSVPETGREVTSAELQAMLDAVKVRLGIEHPVTVVLVDEDPHLVSVATPRQSGAAFLVQIQRDTVALLTDDEMTAVLAHELGHVWVFTHHPYLQTELLANQVAMRAVSRDVLARVYEKIWQRGGFKGSLIAFLGE